MSVNPGECRQHALDCVRLAQTATTPEARKTLSDLAKTWLRFASDLEANECVLDEWGSPGRRRLRLKSEAASVTQNQLGAASGWIGLASRANARLKPYSGAGRSSSSLFDQQRLGGGNGPGSGPSKSYRC